jgi:hypothetical protein
LISSAIRTQVASEALDYAAANRAGPGDPGIASVDVVYPDDYQLEDLVVRLRVSLRGWLSMLFAGLVGDDDVSVNVEALSEIRQR